MKNKFSFLGFVVAIVISAITAQACPEKGCVDPSPWPVRNPPCHTKCLSGDIENTAASKAAALFGGSVTSVQSDLQRNLLTENTDNYTGTVHVELQFTATASTASVDCEIQMLAQHTEAHTYKSYDQINCH